MGAESLPLILLSGPVYVSQEKEEPLKTVACSAFASQALLGCERRTLLVRADAWVGWLRHGRPRGTTAPCLELFNKY